MRSANLFGRGVLIRSELFASISFLAIVFLFGGASRPDALGQPLVRIAGWIALVGVVLTAATPRRDLWSILAFLAAACMLAFAHVIPIPPDLWQSLPGRELMTEVSNFVAPTPPWRPLSIAPGASWNALYSLVVPAAMLGLLVKLDRYQLEGFILAILALVFVSAFLGLLQYSGVVFSSPFVNDERGMVVGPFANRNHFALLLAMGCTISIPWILRNAITPWRGAIVIASLAFFLLLILATGSRMGLLLALIGIGLGLFIAFRSLDSSLWRGGKSAALVLISVTVLAVGGVIAASVSQDRALSITRLAQIDGAERFSRFDIWETTIGMASYYFPAGTGMGTFDPAFRIHEPIADLYPNYVNQAHNDFLGLVLDAGLPGAILLTLFIGWFARTSMTVWRKRRGQDSIVEQVGSSILILIMLASLVDYPARTPIIMALAVAGAVFMKAPAGKEWIEGR